jgi:hypothetical protein
MLALLLLLSCTDNSLSRSFGGTMEVSLPCGQKLVMVTWKGASLWYATRPMLEGELPVVTTFQEKSPRGLQEGTVILTECSVERH